MLISNQSSESGTGRRRPGQESTYQGPTGAVGRRGAAFEEFDGDKELEERSGCVMALWGFRCNRADDHLCDFRWLQYVSSCKIKQG
jgi:hypothetical protein